MIKQEAPEADSLLRFLRLHNGSRMLLTRPQREPLSGDVQYISLDYATLKKYLRTIARYQREALPAKTWATLKADLDASGAARHELKCIEGDDFARLEDFLIDFGQRAEDLAGNYPRLVRDVVNKSQIADNWLERVGSKERSTRSSEKYSKWNTAPEQRAFYRDSTLARECEIRAGSPKIRRI